MAIVEELFADRTETISDSSTAEIAYVVSEAADEAEVRAAAVASIPATYEGLPRVSITLDERLNNDTWKVIARFEKPKYPGQGGTPAQPAFSFDTGGNTRKITQSLSTIGAYGSGAYTPPDFKGAINVAGNGANMTVDGVDIVIPTFNFSETHYLADSVVTWAYRYTLFALTGKVNDAGFRAFGAGEVLFMGASGSQRGDDNWEITFNFAASETKSGLVVGDIAIPQKRGWEYLWVRYGQDADANAIAEVPKAAYVEQVYEYGEFSALGIGTGI